MVKRWTILPYNEQKAIDLQKELKINSRLCSMLVNRGIDTFEKAKDFFRPQLSHLHDPFLMKDMQKAVDRILLAIERKEKILVYGDYDVDGTTSVASMYQFLLQIYQPTLLDYYIPHRYREGYGISKMGIDYAKENNYRLIISLDCGIKSVELIGYAKTLGVDFVVCDHHLPDTTLPPAVAILNPKQNDCTYPYKDLCGCGVGLKLMQALSKKLNLSPDSYLQFLDLAATAIAADIVPITGENRVIAYFGLQKINSNPNVGIKALMQLAEVKNVLTITNVVFIIAPRVNAAGRMDDARKAVQLFVEKEYTEALRIAALLHTDNSDRKEADSTITEEALKLLEENPNTAYKKTTVVYKEHWHKGVVGIVASRLIEKHYKPTVVLTRSGEIAAGSARSVVGFNLYEAIHACREYLLGYGGHFAAAGLTLLPENVNAFSTKFEKIVSAQIEEHLLIPEIIIDSAISFSDVSEGFYNIIGQMEPFGPENMRPVFISKKVIATPNTRIVKELHVKFELAQNGTILSGIGFNLWDKFHLIESKQPLDVLYTLDENEWNGNTTIQLKVIDFRIAE